MKKTIPFLTLIILSSCSINGNLQGLYSYYNRTTKESPNLIIDSDSAIKYCELKNDGIAKIYPINGLQLNECLKRQDKSIVFVWSPNCKGKFCYSLNAVQETCDENNMELFIVAEYYDDAKMQIDYVIKRPIFGIDTKYYKTNLTSKYMSKFLLDVTAKETTNGRFLKFKGDKFQQSFSYLDSIH